jgi:hypothetical protein
MEKDNLSDRFNQPTLKHFDERHFWERLAEGRSNSRYRPAADSREWPLRGSPKLQSVLQNKCYLRPTFSVITNVLRSIAYLNPPPNTTCA